MKLAACLIGVWGKIANAESFQEEDACVDGDVGFARFFSSYVEPNLKVLRVGI